MTRPLLPEDLYRYREVADVVTHPDGERLVYRVSGPDAETDRNRSVLRLRDGQHDRLLTRGLVAVRPRWSPDGTCLAYLAADGPDVRPQARVLDLRGGEAVTVTDLPDGVGAVEWVRGGEALVVVAPSRPDEQVGIDDEELARRQRVIDTLHYRADGLGFTHDRVTQLHLVELDEDGAPAGEPIQLTTGDAVSSPVVAPDGQRVAVGRTGGEGRSRGSRIEVVELDGHTSALTEGDGNWVPAAWWGDRLVVLGAQERGVVHEQIHVVGPTAGVPERRDLGDVTRRSLFAPDVRALVIDGDTAVALAVTDGRQHVERVDLHTGETSTLVGGDVSIDVFDLTSDGSVVAARATVESVPELVRVSPEGSSEVLTAVGADLAETALTAPVEEVRVPSSDGTVVHAFVVRPPAGDGPFPALVYVHGGPKAAYRHAWFDEFQMAAAAGYVVIGGNPRGSDGFGLDHARAIVGHLGEPDWDDVQALTDHLAALPDVDEARIGIGGGSYGGWMTGWAIGHTDRYRAALVERAVTNWETFVGTSDIGSFFANWYVDDTDLDELRHRSPVHHLDGATTPSLVMSYEQDWRCPFEQAEQLYVGLRRRGVEATLVRIPGESHGMTRGGRPSRRIDRFRLVHDFYARHLGGGTFPPPEDE